VGMDSIQLAQERKGEYGSCYTVMNLP
jgi:hypothetical protein